MTHSCPTRRSSDLAWRVRNRIKLRGRNCLHAQGTAGRKGTVRTPRLSRSGCGKPVTDDTWITRQSTQDNLRTAARTDSPSSADAAARRRYSLNPGRYPSHQRGENSYHHACHDSLTHNAYA